MEDKENCFDLQTLVPQLVLRIEKLEQELATCVKQRELVRLFNEYLASEGRAGGGV